MELILINCCKSKRKFKKISHVEKKDIFKIFFSRWEKNVGYYDGILN